MKRLLIIVLILMIVMIAVPAFAEPINSAQFVYAYVVRAVDLGANMTPVALGSSDDVSFFASPVILALKDGKVISGSFYLNEKPDKDTNKRLIAFLGAFIEPNPSYDVFFGSLAKDYLSIANKFIDVMKTADSFYMLTDDYYAVYLPDTGVYVKLLNETP